MIPALLQAYRHIIVGGSGGVGKTSVSAALGIASARAGYNTLVLTIDPARRLAGALGLKEFPREAVEITDTLRQQGVELPGRLWVMMLEVEDAFRPLIERHIQDPALKRRIYENPLYREITRSLSGTPEYAALRKFAEISADPRYERLILDTPPTTHALHFLDAPMRLKSFFESGWIRIFVGLGGRTGFRLLRRGTDLLLSVMERLTGSHLLRTIGDFLSLTQGVFDPIEKEVEEVERLLREGSSFVVVTAPLPDELRETRSFLQSLRALRIPVGGVIVNQLLPPLSATLPEPGESLPGELIPLLTWLTRLKERVTKERDLCEDWKREEKLPVLLIPKAPEDIHTIPGLLRLEQAIASPIAGV